jgi:hypothetical protein
VKGTIIDNTASIAIADLVDPTAVDNTSVARITVGSETYLPYTGADLRLLVLLATFLGIAGLTIRRSAMCRA